MEGLTLIRHIIKYKIDGNSASATFLFDLNAFGLAAPEIVFTCDAIVRGDIVQTSGVLNYAVLVVCYSSRNILSEKCDAYARDTKSIDCCATERRPRIIIIIRQCYRRSKRLVLSRRRKIGPIETRSSILHFR